MQIVLVGQPELKKTIANYELRQLRQRISVHSQIDPLTCSETEDYIYHRLEKAGNREALQWGDGTFELLFNCSQGIPRLINIFCDFILLAAYAEGITVLDLAFVQEVVSDVSWDKHVSEFAGDVQVAANNLPRRGLAERLSIYEQKIAALEALLVHRDEINVELKEQKELLKEILEIQEKGFRRMEVSLERTCHHLQMYLTGFAAKDLSDMNLSDIEEMDTQESSKSLLSKLFS